MSDQSNVWYYAVMYILPHAVMNAE